jgi:hypothetical protein
MLITKLKNFVKTTIEHEIKEKNVEDNSNLSSPEVQLQLNLKIWKKTIES